jgi:hypothetical protein
MCTGNGTTSSSQAAEVELWKGIISNASESQIHVPEKERRKFHINPRAQKTQQPLPPPPRDRLQMASTPEPEDGKELYALLHLAPDASNEEIRRAYRSFAQIYHPDKYQDPQVQPPLILRDSVGSNCLA